MQYLGPRTTDPKEQALLEDLVKVTRFVISQADATANPAQVGERIRIVATSETISLPFPQDPVQGQTITIITHQDSDAGFFAELSSTGIPFRVEDTESTAPHVLRFSVDDNGTETTVDGEYVLTFTGAFWTLDNPVSLTMPGAPDQTYDPLSERAQSGVAVEQSVEPLRASILSHSVTVTDGANLQAAIDEVHDTAGKGDVLVVGELILPGMIDMLSGVKVRGQHKNRSFLRAAPGIDPPGQWINIAGNITDTGLYDITLHGDDTYEWRFLYMASGCRNITLHNVGARNVRSADANMPLLRAADDVGGLRIKGLDTDNVNIVLMADGKLFDSKIEDFVVRNWTSRVFWLKGEDGFSQGVSWGHGYIYPPATDSGFGGAPPAAQPRQPFAIQGASANDNFDDNKHTDLTVDDVTIYGPQIPWINGISNGATADQFSFHHTKNSVLSRCVSIGGGDTGYTITQYCKDITLLQCEARNCDTAGAAIGVTGAGTQRVTVIGGVFDGNGLDIEGLHTTSAGNITSRDSDDLRIVGGTRLTDFNDPSLQNHGIRLINCKRYYVCPSTLYINQETNIDVQAGSTEYTQGYENRLLDTDTTALVLDGTSDSRIDTESAGSPDIISNGAGALQVTFRLQLRDDQSVADRGILGGSATRIWIKILANGTHEFKLRVDGGATFSTQTTPAIPNMFLSPIWLRYEWDFNADEYRVLYSRELTRDEPTGWVTHSTISIDSAITLSTVIGVTTLCFGAPANEPGGECAMTLYRAMVSNGPDIANLTTGIEINPLDAYYNPTNEWSTGDRSYTPRGAIESIKVNESKRADTVPYVLGTVYADDTAAGAGGLSSGQIYSTATGELRVKL